jgi:SHS2 domain-containing protein
VAFLSELVFAAEQENLVFDQMEIILESTGSSAEAWALKVEMSGAPILSIGKAIKAVTYHNLQIRRSERGCEVEIVFDV